MKKWYTTAVLTAALVVTMLAPVGAVSVDPAVNSTNLEAYYITSGKKYDEIQALVLSLIAADGTADGSYDVRIDKNVVGDFFYHVSVYDKQTHERFRHFFVAKDKSCVWQLRDNEEAVLVYGTADELLKKASVVVYPKTIPLGSYGIIRVHIPGSIPYDIKVTSLNGSVASISDKMNIIPVKTGKTDIVVDVRVGQTTKTFTQSVKVVDTADERLNQNTGRDPSIGIGIGIGWGGGWRHSGGGIGIGMGPWW